MENKNLLLIGGGLLIAYLVFNNLKANKRANDLETKVASMNQATQENNIQLSNVGQLASEVVETPAPEQPQQRVRLNEMPLSTRY
jgi:hypothetical protein